MSRSENVLPTFLQPIQTRLVMLQTGFRAMMGVKIYGSDLKEIERIGLEIEQMLKQVPGATDIVADRIVGKPYLEFEIDRDRIARYGVSIRDVQDVIEIAIGGMNIMESVEGRERYPIRVRYLREFREDVPELEKILVPSSSGAQIPLAQVLTIKSVLGPQEIKGERGLLVGYVTMNTHERHGVEIDLCPKCRGVWLDRGELDKMIERSARMEPSYRRDGDGDSNDDDDDDHHRRSVMPYAGPGHDPRDYPQKRKSFWSELFD